MKNWLVVLFLFLASCGCAGTQREPGSAGVTDVLEATVFVHVHISGTIIMQIDADHALAGPSGVSGSWTGTAVVYEKLRDGEKVDSLLLSAHHVLELPAVGDLIDHGGLKMRVDEVSMKVITRTGLSCDAEPLALGDHASHDVATAIAHCDAGLALPIAGIPPPVGAKVYSAGHPGGIEPAIVVDGYFSGWTDDGYMISSVPAFGGSSGSALVYRGRIVGIIARVYPSFTNVSLSTSLEHVQKRVAETRKLLGR